jgi:DNA-binding MarR family transcriptional regulator
MSRRFFELILALKRKCQKNEEEIQEELGLSQAEFHALIVLDERQEVSGCAFAERMVLSPSRGSRVLDLLVQDGYVKTAPGSTDRRAIVISLTPKGRRAKQRIVDHMEACEQRICNDLDDRTVSRIKEVLESLVTVL